MKHIASALLGLAAALAVAPARALPVVDQEFTAGCCLASALAESQSFTGQLVTAGRAGMLVRVELEATRRADFNTPWILGIQEVAGGLPTGNVLSSTLIPASAFPTDFPFVGDRLVLKVDLARPVSFNAGDRYAIVLHPQGVEGVAPSLLAGLWVGNVDAGYAGGTAFNGPFADELLPEAYDLHFRTFVQEVPEPSQVLLLLGGLAALLGVRRRSVQARSSEPTSGVSSSIGRVGCA